MCPTCNLPPGSEEEDEPKYKWEFMVLLQDWKGHLLPVIIADEDADHLIGLAADKYSLPPLTLTSIQSSWC